jgi:predicted nucleic acid-binding protein
VRRIAVDANVFVSFFIDRYPAQHAGARALIQSAEDDDAVATFDRKFANKLQIFGLESYF